MRETGALRAALVPGFDGLYADALAKGAVIPMLVRPESAQFREKYATALMSVFRLA
jgi:hypothetical protein